jgi:hypothetical protein
MRGPQSFQTQTGRGDRKDHASKQHVHGPFGMPRETIRGRWRRPHFVSYTDYGSEHERYAKLDMNS